VEQSKTLLLENLLRKHGAVIYNEHGLHIVYGGDTRAATAEYNQIRVDLAQSHMRAIDRDFSGTSHYLSAFQITSYHWEVFGQHGLPRTTFGGSQGTGTYLDVWLFGGRWCPECDK